MRLRFSGFNWDSGNSLKCEKHGVSKAEVENLFIGGAFHVGPDRGHSEKEGRFFAIGKTRKAKRHIFVIFTVREINGETLVRPISARFMHKQEIEKYEKAFT